MAAYRADQKALVEFIGTFFLVLIFACSALLNPAAHPLAVGASVIAMVYGGCHISGASYNPAIALALLIEGNKGGIGFVSLLYYWVSQIAGAVAAAIVAEVIAGKTGSAEPIATENMSPTIAAEFFFSFALAYIFLNVSDWPQLENHSFHGLSIGCTVLASTIAVGSGSIGVFNPAVAIGAGILDIIDISSIWMHISADMAGGFFAGIVSVYVNVVKSPTTSEDIASRSDEQSNGGPEKTNSATGSVNSTKPKSEK